MKTTTQTLVIAAILLLVLWLAFKPTRTATALLREPEVSMKKLIPSKTESEVIMEEFITTPKPVELTIPGATWNPMTGKWEFPEPFVKNGKTYLPM
jgi:hypothetical protein